MWGDRNAMRVQFVEAWRKAREGLPLLALESQIADVVADHPEYHDLLADRDCALAAEFSPEAGRENPFLHMALHLALREQAQIDRPPGIRSALAQLAARLGQLEAEHRVLDCLGEALWASQRSGSEPDMAAYLECIQRKLVSGPPRRMTNPDADRHG